MAENYRDYLNEYQLYNQYVIHHCRPPTVTPLLITSCLSAQTIYDHTITDSDFVEGAYMRHKKDTHTAFCELLFANC
jgi:hypothetical protein